jgi:excisionase family DNA binding protein
MQNSSIQFLQITPTELAVMVAHEVQNVLRPYLAVLQTPPTDQFLTREQVCKRLAITPTTLWSRTRDGQIVSQKIGRRILYKESDVNAAVQLRNFGGGAVK